LLSDHFHSPAAFTPRKDDGSYYTEGWFSPRIILGASSR